ncbi:uncharacterized protein [Cherax quadricarinatus]
MLFIKQIVMRSHILMMAVLTCVVATDFEVEHHAGPPSLPEEELEHHLYVGEPSLPEEELEHHSYVGEPSLPEEELEHHSYVGEPSLPEEALEYHSYVGEPSLPEEELEHHSYVGEPSFPEEELEHHSYAGEPSLPEEELEHHSYVGEPSLPEEELEHHSYVGEPSLPGEYIEEPYFGEKPYVGFPPGSYMEIQWSANLPFDTFTYYDAVLRIGVPIKFPFPEIVILDVEERSARSQVEEGEGVHSTHGVRDRLLQKLVRSRRIARQERTTLYRRMEDALQDAGVDGASCLLRAICEVAEAPFDQGLIGDVINTLLTASLAGRPDSPEEGTDYEVFLEAELHGKLAGRCEERYHQCHTSPFDLIPNVHHTLS